MPVFTEHFAGSNYLCQETVKKVILSPRMMLFSKDF